MYYSQIRSRIVDFALFQLILANEFFQSIWRVLIRKHLFWILCNSTGQFRDIKKQCWIYYIMKQSDYFSFSLFSCLLSSSFPLLYFSPRAFLRKSQTRWLDCGPHDKCIVDTRKWKIRYLKIQWKTKLENRNIGNYIENYHFLSIFVDFDRFFHNKIFLFSNCLDFCTFIPILVNFNRSIFHIDTHCFRISSIFIDFCTFLVNLHQFRSNNIDISYCFRIFSIFIDFCTFLVNLYQFRSIYIDLHRQNRTVSNFYWSLSILINFQRLISTNRFVSKFVRFSSIFVSFCTF